jgi:protein SCO1/2
LDQQKRALGLVLLALAASCQRHPPGHGEPPHAVSAVARTRTHADTASLYDLPVRLRSSDGHTLGLGAQRGHVVLVTMFYATCPAACPVLIEEVRHVVQAAGDPDVRVVLVSFDAERDTPARLRELAAARHLDARWTLASASETDARMLAAALAIKYRKLGDGSFSHTAAIVALDAEGRPFARVDRLGEPDALVAALRP